MKMRRVSRSRGRWQLPDLAKAVAAQHALQEQVIEWATESNWLYF